MKSIYLDHAATTPLDSRILDAMMPYLAERFGNPSSVHAEGRAARHAVEEARQVVARLTGSDPSGVIFTSGGTESNNLAIRGVVADRSGAILTCAAEHESVLNTARALAAADHPVEIVAPGPTGAVDPDHLREKAQAGCAILSIMFVNNEIGTISPLEAIAETARTCGIPWHCDAVQAAGYFALDGSLESADMLTLSAHKIGGPKGIGALVVRGDLAVQAQLGGGAQERGRRAGTENVAGIIGFARALELAESERTVRVQQVTRLRDTLRASLAAHFDDRVSFTTPRNAAPHILQMVFDAPEGRPLDQEMLLLGLDLEGLRVSAGSACSSGSLETSHVLRAIGVDVSSGRVALRISLGPGTSTEDTEQAAAIISRVVDHMSGIREAT